MTITWQHISSNKLSATQLYDILMLRNQVFIVEQNCPYQDIDGLDLLDSSIHILGYSDEKIAAYARILNIDHSPEPVRIGRVIIESSFRGQGLGNQLLENAMSCVQGTMPDKVIQLSAQAHLTRFYGHFGFSAISEEYLEDNIPHIDMEYAEK